MSSILTNNSAMVALQTLKNINSNLSQTQNYISTGKAVSSAKDNSAVWAISKTMESDVQGFKSISDSLALGESTVAVARTAAESVTDLLTEMKGYIVAAQEENVDRDAIQKNIDDLEAQISSVVGAAQFNGLNLVDGNSTDAMNILSSLDRDSSGNITSRQISVDRQNLSVTTPVTSAVFGTTDITGTLSSADDAFVGSGSTTNTPGTDYDATTDNETETLSIGASQAFTVGAVAAGYSYQIVLDEVDVNVAGGGSTAGERTFEYVASATDGTEDVARNLTSQINAFFGAATNASSGYTVTQGTGTNSNQFTITNGAGSSDIAVFLKVTEGGTAGSSASSGGLGAVQNIDVTTDSGATGALAAIDDLIAQSIDAAATFGAAEGRIETQSSFISKLTDSLKTGIGSMVDANMEETSARLQALQVQQQLATQSLSIANSAPQSILALFRG